MFYFIKWALMDGNSKNKEFLEKCYGPDSKSGEKNVFLKSNTYRCRVKWGCGKAIDGKKWSQTHFL